MKCTYCHTNPGTKKTGVWCGFRDADTGDLVCWGCQPKHYLAKAKTEFAGMYSELPVMSFNPQLRLAI
jgi:hypothetical protein